nr:hypothetical 8.1K protein - porcine epidemic diarrhea virus (isolate Belgian CV777) [Porcine epidemic diarrhea virus]
MIWWLLSRMHLNLWVLEKILTGISNSRSLSRKSLTTAAKIHLRRTNPGPLRRNVTSKTSQSGGEFPRAKIA